MRKAIPSCRGRSLQLSRFKEEKNPMRHRNYGRKLSRNTSHRRALLRNLVTSLILEERISTTVAKAKAARGIAEEMITLGKRGDLHSRRLAAAYCLTPPAVKKLFEDLARRYEKR